MSQLEIPKLLLETDDLEEAKNSTAWLKQYSKGITVKMLLQ